MSQATAHHDSSFDADDIAGPKVRRVRLFGQFLIDEGVLQPEELSEALALMTAMNSTLGELAVERGYITEGDAEEINRLQRRIDGRWGDIAIELGFGRLSPLQLERLRDEQDTRNLRLSDAVVELGFASATEIDHLYARYEEEAMAGNAVDGLPADYAQCPHVAATLEVLPRVVRRLLRTPLRMSRPREVEQPRGLDVHLTICLTPAVPTDAELRIGLSVCRTLAAATSSLLGPAATDVADAETAQRLGLSELLGALVNQAEQHVDVSMRGCVAEVQHGQLPEAGIMFDLALGHGEAILVVQRLPPV